MDIGSGDDLVDGGRPPGEAAGKDYNEHRYHKPGDQYDPGWKLEGVMEDLERRVRRRPRTHRPTSGRTGIRAIRSGRRATG